MSRKPKARAPLHFALEFEIDNTGVDKELQIHSAKALHATIADLIESISEYGHVRVYKRRIQARQSIFFLGGKGHEKEKLN